MAEFLENCIVVARKRPECRRQSTRATGAKRENALGGEALAVRYDDVSFVEQHK